MQTLNSYFDSRFLSVNTENFTAGSQTKINR